jgi:hypothetical protein
MQVPLLALAGLILVELALGGTPRILFMELLRRRTCGARSAGAVGAYQVSARDAVRRSLAAPWPRRIGDWPARTVSTRP